MSDVEHGSELAAAALDSVADHVAILDPEGRIVLSNAAWRSFGEERGAEDADGFLGENYVGVCVESDDEYAQSAAEGLQAVLDGERDSFSLEYPCHEPNERRWFMLQATPVDYHGERYVVVTHVNITERRLAELEVERHAEELQQRQETLALINQLVRHDIRNDMEVVIGWAEVLYDHVDDDGAAYLDDVLEMSHHVTELTRSVGSLVETLTEDDDLDLKPVDLVTTVETQLDAVRGAYDRRSESITVTGPDVDPDADYRVVANDLLSSVVGNLVENALLHNDASDPHVSVSVESDDDHVVLSVADDGPGIPDDRKEDVFGRGEKGLESSGSGLGLYLVDRLVDLYGGSVSVADNDPRGAVFRVCLRRAGDADGDAATDRDEDGIGQQAT